MVKTIIGAFIGFFGGLLMGWIFITFIITESTIAEFENMTNISSVLVGGIVGIIIGSLIAYSTDRK